MQGCIPSFCIRFSLHAQKSGQRLPITGTERHDRMNILAIGDVVGAGGCDFLRAHLPSFKKLNQIDVCIVNGENAAPGNGITPAAAQDLFTSGADLITTGNHVYRRREIYTYLDETEYLIRPANYRAGSPGRGYQIIDKGRVQIAVINLLGVVFLDPLENPFDCVDRLLRQEEFKSCRIKIVDFHAEATAEKRALGFYLDGRVSALFGTHTHVQTADEQILPQGTGYLTDLGMTGEIQSVLGVRPELAIEKMRTGMPVRFENGDGPCMMCGCIFEIDEHSGKTTQIQRVCIQ